MTRVKFLMVAGTTGPFVATAIAACLLTATLAGCARGGKTAATGNKAAAVATPDAPDAPVKPELRYKVAATTTDFFHVSPLQAAGPDEKLKKDTRVTLVKRFGGYSEIKNPGGTTGYVASDEITRLSPQEISEEDAALLARQAPPGALAPLTNAPSGPGANYQIPPEATRDTVLPVPDTNPSTAKPTPNPMFRY